MNKLCVLTGWLALTVSGFAGGQQQRVAVSVSGSLAGQWQGVLTAELGKFPELQLVERQEAERVWRERGVLALADGQRVPPLLGISRYLHFREISHGKWLVETVDGADGRLLGSVNADGDTLDNAPSLAAAGRKLLRDTAAADADGQRRPRIAIIEGAGEDSFALAAQLREALTVSGCVVLDRALTQDIAITIGEGEQGMRDTVPNERFLGADYLLIAGFNDGNVVLTLIRAADGQMAGHEKVKVSGGRLAGHEKMSVSGGGLVGRIQEWLLSKLNIQRKQNEILPIPPYQPSVEVEALLPFYRGLKLYDNGDFTAAASEFTRAYLINRQFAEAYEWEARCYDALTLTPLANAARRYAAVMLDYAASTNATASAAGDAVAFLGIVSDVPNKLDIKLSVMFANSLSKIYSQGVVLPETLEQTKREHDWLVGLTNADGHRWEQTPPLLCRVTVSGRVVTEDGKTRVRWRSRDMVTGKITSAELSLSADEREWEGQIEKFLSDQPSVSAVKAAQLILSAEAAEKALREARGLDANVALLNLAAADPVNPLLASCSFEKADDLQRLNVGEFLTFAFREWLVEKMPRGHPQRRWLELTRIYSFIPYDPRGKIISGKREDYLELLRKFISVSGADLPGLLARYSLLYDTQGQLPLTELIATSEKLLADLKAADSGEFKELGRVADYTEAILRLARIANGETNIEFDMEPMNTDERWGDSLPCPRSIRVAWQRGKPVPALSPYVPWRTNIVSFFKMTPEEKITAARSCLLIYGRGGFTEIARDGWLAQNPNSLTMTAFAITSLDEIWRDLGLPIQHRFDGKAEVASYRKQIAYAADGVEYWLGRVRFEDVLRYTDYVNRLLGALNERSLTDVYSDAEYAALHEKLNTLTAEAFRRTGRENPSQSADRHLSWPQLTREKVSAQTAHILYNFDEEPLNRDWFANKLAEAEQAAVADGEFNPAAWWELLRTKKLDEAFTYPELAKFYRKLHGPSLRLAADGGLTGKELSRLFEQALTLLYGGERAAAGELLEKLWALPVTDLNRGYNSDLIRVNTAYRLAQLYRADGRLTEAVQKLQEGLQLAGGGTFRKIYSRLDEKWEGEIAERGVSGDLARKMAGVLGDLRFQPERGELPDRVGVVTVPTPNLDNPELRIFYRAPAAAADGQPSRVLALAVGSNAEALSYLQPGSAWARFADAHNLALVVPQFRVSTYHWNSSSVFCHYANAQVWSGAAFLAGLDQISERCPLQKDRLLFHAYAPGTGFACRFARWRPDLVAAVALCRPSQGGLARFAEPGLQPLKSLSAVKLFIGAAEIDDDQCRDKTDTLYNRYESAVHFATLLQAADVQAEWKNYPGLEPPPVAELEQDAREFLEKNL